MFSHIMIGANNVEAMLAFYDSVLATLGLARDPVQTADSPAGFIWQRRGQRWPQFALTRPFDGQAASAGNGVQVSFAAASRQHVVAAWQTAIDHGGSDEGEPGIRPQYSDDFFAAYCRDPAGNKLCFVHAHDLPQIIARDSLLSRYLNRIGYRGVMRTPYTISRTGLPLEKIAPRC